MYWRMWMRKGYVFDSNSRYYLGTGHAGHGRLVGLLLVAVVLFERLRKTFYGPKIDKFSTNFIISETLRIICSGYLRNQREKRINCNFMSKTSKYISNDKLNFLYYA